MSFLLRKSGSGGRKQPPQRSGLNPRLGASRNARPTTARPAARSSGGGQLQQLRQRPVQQQAARQKQDSSKATQEQQTQNAISYEEVMEDLRILEKQQVESQRKLEMVKATKQQKLQQRTALENRLAKLKYSNGEQRAQIQRAREVLSRSGRELGAAELLSSQAGENLKAFDSRLKRALMVHRILQVTRRKIDAGIIRLRNKHSIIVRLRSEACERIKAAEAERDEVLQREQSLRQLLQEKQSQAGQLIEETSKTRSEVSALEQELATAQRTGESTKLQVQTVASEIESEEKRHIDAMQAMQASIEESKTGLAEAADGIRAIAQEFKEKKAEVLETWQRCVQYQKEAGFEVTPKPKDGSPLPTIDVQRFRNSVKTKEASLEHATKRRDGILALIEQKRQELERLRTETAAAKSEADTVRKAAVEALAIETKRREKNEATLAEIAKERAVVDKLRRSVSEMKSSVDDATKRVADKRAEQGVLLQNSKRDLEEKKARLANVVKSIADMKETAKQESLANAARIESAKLESDQVKATLEKAQGDVDSLGSRLETEYQEKIEAFRQAKSMLLEDTRDELDHLLQDYPELSELDLNIAYEPKKSAKEQGRKILCMLKEACHAQIDAARAEHKEMTRNQDTERERKNRQRTTREENVAARGTLTIEDRQEEHSEGETKSRKGVEEDTKADTVGEDHEAFTQKSVRWEKGLGNDADIVDDPPTPKESTPMNRDSIGTQTLAEQGGERRGRGRSRSYGKRDKAHLTRSSKSSRNQVTSILKVKDARRASRAKLSVSPKRSSSPTPPAKRSLENSASSQTSNSNKRLKLDESLDSSSTKAKSSETRARSDLKAPQRVASDPAFNPSSTEHSSRKTSKYGKPSSTNRSTKESSSKSLSRSKSTNSSSQERSGRDSAHSSRHNSARVKDSLERAGAKRSSSRTGQSKSKRDNDSRSKASQHSSSSSKRRTKQPQSQSTGISSMELASKSVTKPRRRTKKEGAAAKSKNKEVGISGAAKDYGFHFG